MEKGAELPLEPIEAIPFPRGEVGKNTGGAAGYAGTGKGKMEVAGMR